MEIGLFFGSFNPIHIGHLIVANTAVELTELQQVWFVVSPQNPFKKQNTLLHEFDRLDMVRLAIDGNPNLNATDVEFHLPRPSYTATTLVTLAEKYPQHRFKVIMGSDNLQHLHKWRSYELILKEFGVMVYPRHHYGPKADTEHLREELRRQVGVIGAPLIELSATLIREMIRNGRSIQYLVPEAVAEHIRYKKFYR